MKITLTLIKVADEAVIETCETIEHEGKLWLVPRWRVEPTAGIERPERIICLHGLPMQGPPQSFQDKADRHLIIPLSRATLEGSTAQGLVVIEAPDIVRNVNRLH